MVWLLLVLGLAFLIFLIARSSPTPPQPRRRRDHGGSGVVLLDGAPLLGPDHAGLGLTDAVVFDSDDAHAQRFQPGGGSGGGAGASGSWDEGADFIDSDDHGGWDASDGDDGGGD